MLKLLVNLDSDTQRYEYVNSQFQKLGIDITRVSAVDLRKASEDELKQYVAKLTSFNKLMRFPRTLLKGEVGCFLSHRKCWETLVKSNENYAFICEDDIVIADSIKEYLSDEKWLHGLDLVMMSSLGHEIGKDFKWTGEKLSLDNGNSIVFPYKLLGTQGYIISKKCALKAIELSEKIISPVDDFLFTARMPIKHLFKVGKLESVVVTESSKFLSGIGTRNTKQVKESYLIRHNPLFSIFKSYLSFTKSLFYKQKFTQKFEGVKD